MASMFDPIQHRLVALGKAKERYRLAETRFAAARADLEDARIAYSEDQVAFDAEIQKARDVFANGSTVWGQQSRLRKV